MFKGMTYLIQGLRTDFVFDYIPFEVLPLINFFFDIHIQTLARMIVAKVLKSI